VSKKALALRDGADHEEAVAGELGLIEFATAPGTSPDQLAWELQLRYLGRELLALAPVAAYGLGVLPSAITSSHLLAYAVLVWPFLLLYGTWQPVRAAGRSRLRPAADLCFLGGSGLLGLAGGLGLGTCLGWFLQDALVNAGLTPGYALAFSAPLFLVVAVYTFVRLVTVSLVERELEGLADEQLPATTDLEEAATQVAPVALVGSVSRAAFRTAGLSFLAILPALGTLALSGPLREALAPAAGAWSIVLGLLAAQYFTRALFYLSLTGEGLAQLAVRRRDRGDLATESARRSWRAMRAPGTLARLVGLGLATAWILGSGAMGGATPLVAAGILAILVPLVPLGEEARGTPARRVAASVLGLLPAALLVFGGVAGLGKMGAATKLLGPTVLLLFLALGDRAVWLWARATSRLLGQDAHTPGPPAPAIPILRRAALLGAAIGFPALALAYLVPWGLRELAAAAYLAAAAVGPAVAVVAAMRLHLAIAEAGVPKALPEAPELAGTEEEAAAA
jgi:hypothetical protein